MILRASLIGALLAAIIIGIVLLVCGTSGPIASRIGLPGAERVASNPTMASGQTTLFELGPVTLQFPKEMVGQLGKARSATAGYIFLTFLLPDFEIQNAANASEFQRVDWGRMLSVFLQYPGKLRKPLDPFTVYGGGDPSCFTKVDSNLDGFDKYTCIVGADHIYISQENRNFFIECTDSTRSKSMGIPQNEHCTHFEEVWENIELRYTYSADFISSTKKIDAGLHDLLNSLVFQKLSR